jgi:hypoxanthine phosphoribosyltransferase
VPVRNKTLIKPEMPALHADRRYIIMGDIYDTGDTYNKVADALKGFSYDFAFCMNRYKENYGLFAKMLNHEKWVVFLWEWQSCMLIIKNNSFEQKLPPLL